MLHDDASPVNPAVERALRRAARERAARQEAESLLERKSVELYQTNEKLRLQAQELEDLVRIRTAALEKALEAAQSATSAKSNFLAMMSHEIRTPLNGIIGIADLLFLSPLDDEQSAHLNLLVQSGHTLLALINDILDFSKIEAGHLKLEAREFDPAMELQSTAAIYRPTAQAKGLEIELVLGELPVAVRGDSHRLRQVVSNILSNAIKFTSKGKVSLGAAARRDSSGRWRIEIGVKDTGIGIPRESLAHLFEPFSQADSSTTRKFGGTGLGLAICKRLTEAMDGGISVDSGPGGSTFHFHVHFDAAASSSLASRQDESPSHLASPCELSVLLVEDNAINQTVALTLLKRLGQRTSLADTGRKAVEMIAAGHYDLVFMDMQMPEMDGIEATKSVRHLDLKKQPRIIALTANAFEADRERCLSAGMDGFISKPFRLDDLRREICDACLRCPTRPAGTPVAGA
jgi:signal transduction histidine kinase/ActR/RegA family two-component response regulator